MATLVDWYDLLLKDFKFIGKDLNKKEIQEMTKEAYTKNIKELVQSSDLKYLLEEKENHTKFKDKMYDELEIRPYLTERKFSSEERKLLGLLRSRSFNAKSNFKKLWRGNLDCRLGCSCDEDQAHIFTQCIWLNPSNGILYENIFKGSNEQKEVIKVFIQKEKLRNHLLENLIN